MSEAFHKLNLAREVANVKRFNYICKVCSDRERLIGSGVNGCSYIQCVVKGG